MKIGLKGQKLLAAAFMFLLILVVLITSFQMAIYGDPEYKFYRKEYAKYNVTADLYMQMDDVMDVTDHMMAYLIGEEEELSVMTNVEGRDQDFFNEQDRLHMADVKNLFLGGLKLRTICLTGMILLLIIMIRSKASLSRMLPKAYFTALGVFIAVVAFLGIAFTVDFTGCFTIFHKIFFTNDLWMFDPAQDYMIRMLPEGFFADMVLRIGEIFIIMLIVLWAGFIGWRRIWLKRSEDCKKDL